MPVRPWIGVDLDGTLAEYDGWKDGQIGAPIPRMVERVKQWLANGKEVRIVTARVAVPEGLSSTERLVRENEVRTQKAMIREWCSTYIGQPLKVTAQKDFGMVELWDDRVVQVIKNTGIRADDPGARGADGL